MVKNEKEMVNLYFTICNTAPVWLFSVSPSLWQVHWARSELRAWAVCSSGLFWVGMLNLSLSFLLSWSSLSPSVSSSPDIISPSLPPLPKEVAGVIKWLLLYSGLAVVAHWVSMMYLWPSTQLQTAFTEPKHWPSSTSFRLGQDRQASPWLWAQDTRLWRHFGSEVKDGGA